ncbi:hypothetical protein H696_03851 [Fonticula alba]|uniref:Cleavage and polyadenylation specificity factor subunit 5 n=1 Tax=Fonticula alba TaxID=691883 RepID=A0A058Z5N4_FONAL|nr:hypothetical protein H696_03851 [Fonticula alba]KCV69421.1 hypothetical protein H696_03851 [Fonticula alba]|eukprot:XP_009495986.1 hypothetical protein H696_03851 [Fonticula alba]
MAEHFAHPGALASPVEETLRLYQAENYTTGTREKQPEPDASVSARFARLKDEYALHGMRHSVAAAIVIAKHGHPHLLCLRIAGSFYKLPGDELLPHEYADPVAALKNRLDLQLAPPGTSFDWEVKSRVATWWRPNFEHSVYPYIPAHITRPKEKQLIYLIQAPPSFQFFIPANYTMQLIPFWELHNSKSFGPIISAIPQSLSRMELEYCVSGDQQPQQHHHQQQQQHQQ